MEATSFYADSADSMSPPSRGGDLWEEPLPPPSSPAPARSKLRLMCSSGGHIVPRPHDKTLCYLGGETRIVMVDRHKTLADLHSRLSRAFLPGRAFSIKYQLPAEDLDSLISIATDDDLENMIEEYDRISGATPRIRLFLFPSGNNSSSSCVSSLLEDSKSETWFVDALNGASLRRNPSPGDSPASSVNCLLGLDDLNQLSTLLPPPLPAQQSDDEVSDPQIENPNPNPNLLCDDDMLNLLDSSPSPDPKQEITMHATDQTFIMNQITQQQFVQPHHHHLPPLSSYFQIPIHPHHNVPMYYMPVTAGSGFVGGGAAASPPPPQPPQLLHLPDQRGQFVGYHPLQQHSAAASGGYGFEFIQNRGS